MQRVMTIAVLSVVGMIFLAVVFIGFGVSQITREPDPTPSPQDALGITVEDIYKAYWENEARANSTYKERPLDLEFEVDEIEDHYVIDRLDPLFNFQNVRAEMELPFEDLVKLERGDVVTRRCWLQGFVLNSRLDFDCP